MSPLQGSKLWLIDVLSLGKDALHIYVGLAVMLGVAGLFRLSLRDWRPLFAVLLVALAGEIWDLVDAEKMGLERQLMRNWHDIWNTLFWPAMLFVTARYTRILKR